MRNFFSRYVNAPDWECLRVTYSAHTSCTLGVSSATILSISVFETEHMSDKTVLITGGAGFIGSHLVDRFIAEGDRVAIIDDLSGGNRDNLNPNVEFYECDLRSASRANELISTIRPEIVYHLAANAAENKAQFSPIDITSRNYDTFINTFVPALRNGLKRVIVTSSIAVYGNQQAPFKETAVPEPEDLYGVSKLSMEKSLHILSKVHQFEYVITRPHNVYGPRQNMRDPYRNVVTIFMNALLKGESYYIYGDGSQQRCFSYIDDVVNALQVCATAPVNGMTFNVGSDAAHTLNELSEVLQQVVGTSLPPKYLPSRPLDVPIAIADHTLAKQHLRYEDTTSLREGIGRTWEYAKKLGYQQPEYGGIELDSPLIPKNWRNE